MPKGCVQAVFSRCTSLGTSSNLSTVCTATTNYSFIQRYLVGNLCAAYDQLNQAFEQAFLMVSNLLSLNFYPFSTGPNTTNKLIKDLYI
jgi:hypothetical protein